MRARAFVVLIGVLALIVVAPQVAAAGPVAPTAR
jgi:hypothetical protein